MDITSNLTSVRYFWPEMTLVIGVLSLLVADLFLRKEERRVQVLGAIAFGFLAVSGLATWYLSRFPSAHLFHGLLVHDELGIYFRFLFLAAATLGVWLAVPSREIAPERMGEYLALLLSMCLGMCLMATSRDLLMIYLSLELVSLVSYVLSGYRRNDRRAAEAALKYVIYGGVASGVMLFGMSYLYGMTGTTDLAGVQGALGRMPEVLPAAAPGTRLAAQAGLFAAVFFVLAGIGYKVASVPWHMWCPDVYEGAPTPFTAFLSVGPKAAGFAVAIRFFFAGMSHGNDSGLDGVATAVAGIPWPGVLGVVAAVTMTLGNFAAIVQTNLKRLLAYSSIAHAGYILMGVAAASNLGNMSVLVYLAFYLLMNVGAFLVVAAVAREVGSESIYEYRGLAKRAPFAAVAFAIFLFSLTGLPPLAGFVGKLFLFYSVVVRATASAGTEATGWWLLAVIGLANSAVSLYYYARIIRAMFLDKPVSEEPLELPLSYTSLLAGLVAAVVIFGVWFGPITDAAQTAVASIVSGT